MNNTGIYFGWRETGFLREFLVTGEDIGKNPVSEILGEWRETGFLRRYSMRGEDIGKNPVSEIVGGGEKPGFCEDIQ